MYNMDYKYVIIGRFNEKRSQFPGVCTWGGGGGRLCPPAHSLAIDICLK